jgi:tetratricopeptide (TPR) repeat protein
MPLLDAALKNHADDLVAWHAKGLALRQIGLTAESLQAFEQVLAYEPRNERTLLQAAEAATALGRLDQAINFWKRAIDINPVMPGYFLSLARLHAQKREWSLALSASDQAVRLEPINVDARMLRVTAMVRLGQLEQAEIEFNTILSMRPKNEADLRRAYNALQR